MTDPGLSGATWPQVAGGLLLVPVGACEQHGPHLPLGTDTAVAMAVTRNTATFAEAEDVAVWIAPAVMFGASGEHEDFPGTVSIGTVGLATVLIELGRSALRWADRLVFINGHGGNVDALQHAVPLLRGEGRDVGWLSCGAPGVAADLHAGRTETSLMLAIAPDRVQLDAAEPGDPRPAPEILPELREKGIRAVSPNGVLGDPTGANPDEGREWVLAAAQEAWRRIRDGVAGPNGMLTVAS